MKRCPQCEFIYEDDQSLCDMDGVLLVFDPRTLPNLHELATVPAVPKAQRRNRAVPAFATLVLTLVLGMVYYVSTRQPGYTPTSLNAAPITIPTPEPEPTAEPTPAIEETESTPVIEETEFRPVTEESESKPTAVKESKVPFKKPATKTTSAVPQTKRDTETKKDDSKVNSIIKKTGRILKKPFKF